MVSKKEENVKNSLPEMDGFLVQAIKNLLE